MGFSPELPGSDNSDYFPVDLVLGGASTLSTEMTDSYHTTGGWLGLPGTAQERHENAVANGI